jgi:hypothetical protein
MATTDTRPTGSTSAADAALADILDEIGVPRPVLTEARNRRDLVLDIAMEHEAARARYVSGSVAHGTHNRPLEDTDCGIKVDRRVQPFRQFGPDGDGRGPEEFIQAFATFVLPRLRERGYPHAEVDLTGNRAIRFEFNETVEIDDWGPVDPYVDLIVGLDRRDGGLWIPNRRRQGWDPADPEHHTWLMTKRDPKALRVLRAHVVRLGKRAIKRDELMPGRTKVMCSWNVSALALDVVDDENPIGVALASFFAESAASIATGLTDDPSPVVTEPIKLPEGVTYAMASERLYEMASVVAAALDARSKAGARRELEALYGPELEAIREREQAQANRILGSGGAGGAAATLPFVAPSKRTSSHGSRWHDT